MSRRSKLDNRFKHTTTPLPIGDGIFDARERFAFFVCLCYPLEDNGQQKNKAQESDDWQITIDQGHVCPSVNICNPV